MERFATAFPEAPERGANQLGQSTMKCANILFAFAILAGCGDDHGSANTYSVGLCADCSWAAPGSFIDGLAEPYPIARCESGVGCSGSCWVLASCQGNPACTLPSCSPSAPCCHAIGPQVGCIVPVNCDRPL